MRQLQEKLPKACFRTPREVDEADVVHSCFFSKGVFRDALNSHRNTAHIKAFFFLDIIGFIAHLNFNLPAVGGVPEADVNRTELIGFDFLLFY